MTSENPNIMNGQYLDHRFIRTPFNKVQGGVSNLYKGVTGIVSRPLQSCTKVVQEFAGMFNNSLKEKWILIDPEGNRHIVCYHNCVLNPKITDGLLRIRHYYQLKGDRWFILKYRGYFVFDMFIYNERGRQILYNMDQSATDSFSEPYLLHRRIIQSFNWPCLFMVKIKNYHLHMGKLLLPAYVANHIRNNDDRDWTLIGPQGRRVNCIVNAPPRMTTANIGRGWNKFMDIHVVHCGHVLSLLFSGDRLGIVQVMIYDN